MTNTALHLLHVEDQPTPARRVRDIVCDAGVRWSIDQVASSADAATALQDGSIDAILLSPAHADALTALRAVDAYTPIIVLDDDADVNFISRVDHAVTEACRETLVRERDTMTSALRSMERMMAIVGHELRTPLAGLRATTEFLLTAEAKEAGEWDAFLQLMHDEVIRMAELVNNLLEAARLHSGQTQWHWDEMKLSRVCDEALNVVRPLINHAAVELRWTMDPPNLAMRGDAEAICRMIINFISNAAKHTTEGSITLDVTSHCRDGRPWIVMRFIDTGTGIPPTIIEKLGKAFVLNDGSIGSDYAKGVGLGLSICRGIVAAHAGEIHIESQPDCGCTFTVALPADQSGPIEADDVKIQSVAA